MFIISETFVTVRNEARFMPRIFPRHDQISERPFVRDRDYEAWCDWVDNHPEEDPELMSSFELACAPTNLNLDHLISLNSYDVEDLIDEDQA